MLESWIAGVITVGARVLVNPRVQWSGCEPDARPRIYYSNHSSHLDFVLLWWALPSRLRRLTRPVAASDYWDRVKVRRYMIHRVFQGVLVHRGEPETHDSVSLMLETLDQRHSLILFPEGTRGSGHGLGPFRSGLYHLARARPRIEIVPVWIGNSARVLSKGSFLPVPLLCSVTFGSPLHIERDEEKSGFLERMRHHLLALEAR